MLILNGPLHKLCHVSAV